MLCDALRVPVLHEMLAKGITEVPHNQTVFEKRFVYHFVDSKTQDRFNIRLNIGLRFKIGGLAKKASLRLEILFQIPDWRQFRNPKSDSSVEKLVYNGKS